MVAKEIEPVATWEFEAEVLVLHHPTTISTKYQAMGKWYYSFSLAKPLEMLSVEPG